MSEGDEVHEHAGVPKAVPRKNVVLWTGGGKDVDVGCKIAKAQWRPSALLVERVNERVVAQNRVYWTV